MKYFVLLCDGMADEPIGALGNKTPMEVAQKPCMDSLCAKSLVGTVLNVPPTMVPESSTANLSVLSYNPLIYSRGRSPLEAASMGISLSDDETAFRANLVTLSDNGEPYEQKVMVDHSGDEVTTEEAKEFMAAIQDALGSDECRFYPGISYRECVVRKNAPEGTDFNAPHDIIGKAVASYLPSGEDSGYYIGLMKKSYDILKNHPLNEKRVKEGKMPANSLWLWSPGKRASIPDFSQKWGITGTVISAVDLIKGIAICAGMESVDVDGATGNFDTNYSGKAEAAIDAFRRGSDLVYVHVEAPDECGHRGELEKKIRSIEKIDSDILSPVFRYLSECGDEYRILVLPDHPTPVELRTHTGFPVPFMIFFSDHDERGCGVFCEKEADAKELYLAKGTMLFDIFIKKPAADENNRYSGRFRHLSCLSERLHAHIEARTGEKIAGTDRSSELPSDNAREAPEAASTAENVLSQRSPGIGMQIFSWIELLVIAFSLVLLIMTFIVRHSPVVGESMYPTLKPNDILVVSDIGSDNETGDIVIVQSERLGLSRPLVKRIIAVGGQTIRIDSDNWEVYIDGVLLEESYLDNTDKSLPMAMENIPLFFNRVSESVYEQTVPEGYVFIMGDNRNDSTDSRTFGFVDERHIVGEVKFRLFPLSSAGRIDDGN